MLSYLATGSFDGQVVGMNQLNAAVRSRSTGPATTCPPVEAIYWSMRVMAYAGSLVALISIVGAFLFWKRRLERRAGSSGSASGGSFLPFIACAAGWCLTELGRQPWIVQGLLKTADANSPTVGRVDDRRSASPSSARSTSRSFVARHLADAPLRRGRAVRRGRGSGTGAPAVGY